MTRKNPKKKNHRFLKKMKKRLLVTISIFMALFVVLIVRLMYINISKGSEYEQNILEQQTYVSTVIPYKRGDILDANGTILATSQKVYNLILEPKNILAKDNKSESAVKAEKATKAALKQYFNMTDSELAELLKNGDSYYVVARKKLTYDQVKPFNDFRNTKEGSNVVGAYFEEEYQRVYPNGNLACHLLGYTVSGNVGTYGVEESYNSELNGTNGREYSYLNEESGMTNAIESPVDGNTLVTSIDANAQAIVQKAVEDYMANGTGAKNVSVLVMEPDTCNILALYNSHQYDPNDAYDLDSTRYQFDSDEEFEEFKKNATDEEKVDALFKVWRNFVVSDVYEPGSTYKIFTISGALEEGVVNENDTYFCDGGEEVYDYYIKCASYRYGGHGMQTLDQTLANSCNDALMQISAKEGSKLFDKYQVLYGFGQRTNVDIPGELDSASLSTLVYHEETLNPVELATSSFGQGVTASMIELGTAFCSVINGGYYYEPSVVSRIEDANGNIVKTLDSVLVRKTISDEVSEQMRQMLFKVVEEGTGKKASVEGYEIGGKTGTAEKLPRGNGKYLISFIGFAPIENPQVMMYVIVDEPNLENQSSSPEASYLFADIAEELFPYFNIYKTNDNYDLDLSDAEDEGIDTIYEGNVPENDVAGGADNPYVSQSTGENGDDNPDGDSSEESGEGTTEATTEDTSTTQAPGESQ